MSEEEERRRREFVASIDKSNSEIVDAAFGGGKGGSGGGLVGAVLKLIFFAIPMLLAKIFGWIMGFFLKLGIVGKVLLTATFGIIVAFAMMILCMGTGLFNANDANPFIIELIKLIVFAVIVLTPTAFGGIWFWRHNYPLIKDMPFADFSKILTVGFAIGGYSIAAVVVLGMIFQWNNFGWCVGFFLAIVAAIAYYFFKTRGYAAAQAEQTDSE